MKGLAGNPRTWPQFPLEMIEEEFLVVETLVVVVGEECQGPFNVSGSSGAFSPKS